MESQSSCRVQVECYSGNDSSWCDFARPLRNGFKLHVCIWLNSVYALGSYETSSEDTKFGSICLIQWDGFEWFSSWVDMTHRFITFTCCQIEPMRMTAHLVWDKFAICKSSRNKRDLLYWFMDVYIKTPRTTSTNFDLQERIAKVNYVNPGSICSTHPGLPHEAEPNRYPQRTKSKGKSSRSVSGRSGHVAR